MDLGGWNPHWEDNFSYPYEKKRHIFERIFQSFRERKPILLVGPRGAGKTVLLKQLINQAIREGTERKDVLYFSFEEMQIDLRDLVIAYQAESGKMPSHKTLFILDEIQRLPSWQEKVRQLGTAMGVRFVLTSSASTSADGFQKIPLSALSFRDYLQFQNLPDLLALSEEQTIEKEFLEYVKRPLPALALDRKLEARNYLEALSRKMMYEDLPTIFPIGEPQLLANLFTIISLNPGALLDYQSLASDIGKNRKTISAYLDYLARGFLVREVSNYSENQRASGKKLRKYYPYLSCFAQAQECKTVETAIAQILDARNFWSMKSRYGVDFIISDPLYACQFRYKIGLSPDDFYGMTKFRSFWPKARSLLISRRKEGFSVPYFRLEKYLEENRIICQK